MASRLTWSVYGVSFLVHGALGFGVAGVDAAPPQAHRPVVISVEEIEAEEPEPPPEPEKPEPKKPEPEPEAKPIEPSKPPPAPKPAARKAAPAPESSASSEASGGGDEIFDGGELGNGPGTPIPAGNGGDAARADDPPVREKKVAKAKTLGESKPKAAVSGCEEKAGKPKPIEIPEPQYTERARAAGVEGAVRVEVTVDAKGRVTKVKVLRGLDPDLDSAAKKAIEQARFEPALACGKPVDSTFTISVKFTL